MSRIARLILGAVALGALGWCVAWAGLAVPFEPSDSLAPDARAVGAGLLLLVALGVAVARRRVVAAAFVLVVLGASLGIAAIGESLRWTWSESELRQAATGPNQHASCRRLEPCTVGWWKIGETLQLETATYLQSPTVVPRCEGGGLALPRQSVTAVDVRSELEQLSYGPLVNVEPYRGDWLAVCFYS